MPVVGKASYAEGHVVIPSRALVARLLPQEGIGWIGEPLLGRGGDSILLAIFGSFASRVI